MIIMNLLSLPLMLVGGVLMLRGMWDRTHDAPSVSGGSLKQLMSPVWKQKSWFRTPQAYRRYAWGNLLFTIGCLLGLTYSVIVLIQG